jgi:hypothetical protein
MFTYIFQGIYYPYKYPFYIPLPYFQPKSKFRFYFKSSSHYYYILIHIIIILIKCTNKQNSS